MIRVAVTLPAVLGEAGDFLADVRALEAAGADTIGVAGDSLERWVLLGAIAAVTDRVRLHTAAPVPVSLRALSHGRLVTELPSAETWIEAPVPPDRDSWTAMLRDQEAAGVTGIIVPWDPRLIDLLRNPDPDDRGDLLMSTG